MAKNTGRGTRSATILGQPTHENMWVKRNSSGRFQEMKRHGGDFRVEKPPRNFWGWVSSIWNLRR